MKYIGFILTIVIALVAGFLLRGFLSLSPSHPFTSSPSHSPKAQSPKPQASPYTCSMHPQFKLPEPGKCPICFMDLIPLEAADEKVGEREIGITPYAAKLMELETTEVVRRFAEAEIRMVGKVDYDETRVSTISAWVPGRIDRLFVDFTGIAVDQGDPLAELYSPELLSAQEELLQAVKHNPSLIDAAREKLRLWGFTAKQISGIEERGLSSDHMTIYSPAGGIVIQKNAQEGMYVQTGTKIYAIADLSKVWVQLDAYESDLNGLRRGGNVEFTTETYPGETFEGTISFIDPIINSTTRTAKVRVIADNTGGKLKPGMFVRAVVLAASEGEPPLVIPATAPLQTGKRAIVYVEVPDREKPTYEGREITLGARLGDFYIVKSGLEEGERVVTRGAFKLDAELQIQAKPSMMNPEGNGTLPHAHLGNIESSALHHSKFPVGHSSVPLPQTLCPVMGNPISRDVYFDYNGYRIYFCCPGCDDTFKADPEKYLRQMKDEGVELEKVGGAHHEH